MISYMTRATSESGGRQQEIRNGQLDFQEVIKLCICQQLVIASRGNGLLPLWCEVIAWSNDWLLIIVN